MAFFVIAFGVTWLLQVPAILLAEAYDQTLSNPPPARPMRSKKADDRLHHDKTSIPNASRTARIVSTTRRMVVKYNNTRSTLKPSSR